MHPKEIQELLKILENTDVSELELQEGESKVRIVRAIAGMYQNPALGTPLIVSHANAPQSQGATKPAAEEAKAADTSKGMVVTSPFVGTFYRSPSPSAAPFVEIGSSISKGQTICIVEAMKLMNEIESDYNGRVTQIYVENGQPVEYGDKLFLIEP